MANKVILASALVGLGCCAAVSGGVVSNTTPPCATQSLWLSNSLGLAYNYNHKFAPQARGEGSHYFASISAGDNSPEVFQVLIDTGSADIWLPTVEFAKEFNHTEATAARTGGDFKPYGNGSVNCFDSYGTGKVDHGLLSTGNFNVAGTNAQGPICLEVKGQSWDLPQGIVGIGGCGLSVTSNLTGDYSNCPLNLLGWNSFGLWLSKDKGFNGTGTLSPNGVDQIHHASDFTYEPVNYQLGQGIAFNPDILNFWGVDAKTASVAGKNITLKFPGVFIDSGTPGLTLEADIWNATAEAMGIDPAKPKTHIACDKDVPALSFTLGSGRTYTIPGSAMLQPVNPNYPNGECTFFPQSSGSSPENVLGTNFLQQYYAYFIRKNPGDGMSYVALADAI